MSTSKEYFAAAGGERLFTQAPNIISQDNDLPNKYFRKPLNKIILAKRTFSMCKNGDAAK